MRHILFAGGETRSNKVIDIDPARFNVPAGTRVIAFPEDLGKNPEDYVLQKDELVFNPMPPVSRELTPEEKRKQEYQEKLSQGDQNDAILKGVLALTQLLKTKAGVTDQELEAAGLLPDKTKPIDTPAGWLGTVLDIKTRNPKVIEEERNPKP